jgi:cysteine desulfuration protein SufE
METLEGRLAEVEAEFELVGEWNDRYRLMVDWGTELTPLPPSQRIDENFVHGCSSPLWLSAKVVDGVLAVSGYSPGVLPLALVALLVRLYDGLPVTAGVVEKTDVAHRLGLSRHLTPTRELTFGRLLARVESGR